MTGLTVRNARVFADGRLFRGGVRVENGVITALETSDGSERTPGRAHEVIDAQGGWLLPGAIDLHVHFRDPGRPEKEDFGSGSAAAALGGVTTVLDMPNTDPAVLDAETLAGKREAIDGRSYVDYGLIAAADPSNADRIAELATAGAAAFKIFLYERRDAPPSGVLDDAVLLDLLRRIGRAGLRAHVHAENDSLVKAGRRAEAGAEDWPAHLRSRAPLVEEEAVSRAILFAREAGVPLHVCHLSTAAGLELVRGARRRGQAVTAEATPQHLLLDESGYPGKGADLVMVPPVRTGDDRAALYAGLARGDLDVVATDHAPHTVSDKTGAPLAISTGLVGVQWSYPLMLSEVIAGRLPLDRVVDAMSALPAALLGLRGRKGVIRVGADADLALFLARPSVLRRDDLRSRGRSTPFDGAPVLCRLDSTVVGGRVQVRDGALVGRPTGRFVAPRLPLARIP